jgi:site-specific recombinase XerD
MSNLVALPSAVPAVLTDSIIVPALIADAGDQAAHCFREFLQARLPNKNTRAAYSHAISEFLFWCSAANVASLATIDSLLVARYFDQLKEDKSVPTAKQHLAAVKNLFDWLVTGQIVPRNPASAVRGPKYAVKRGKTPVLSVEEARMLLNGIPTTRLVKKTAEEKPDLVGLRDRALIAVMVYSFARVSAVTAMKVNDYYSQGRRAWFRLHEKGGKRHEVPAHHKAEEFLDAYIDAARIADEGAGPLFRSACGTKLTRRSLTRSDVYRMVRRRAKAAGLETAVSCHSFRATGITAYLENGGSLEHAQQIAAHESPRTTKLYDHTADQITLDEIERIAI